MTRRLDPEVFDYKTLRLSVGFVALLLPPVLVLGDLYTAPWLNSVFGTSGSGPNCNPTQSYVQDSEREVCSSISAYYHSDMGGVFVGALCAIATFFFAYNGKSDKERRASKLGGVLALGVALFPTSKPDEFLWTSVPHYVFAVLLFLLLAFFCFFIFGAGAKELARRRAAYRKRIYYACGVLIVICILIGGMAKLRDYVLNDSFSERHDLIFLVEWAALAAFAVSWFVASKWSLVGILVDANDDTLYLRSGSDKHTIATHDPIVD